MERLDLYCVLDNKYPDYMVKVCLCCENPDIVSIAH